MKKEEIIERFIRYAKIDTQSDPLSTTFPTTMKQFDLSNLLCKELLEMGVSNAIVDENCYVWAEIASNLPSTHPNYGKVPAIGFVAHVDTSPDTTATGCNPQVLENYQGGDIKLGDTDIYIKYDETATLKGCIGHTIVHTDGTTLLGSDDKSGVTAIMELMKFMIETPEFLHGTIKICFTPDEEVGRGANRFDIIAFGCEYAYTIDGGLPIGELNKETFSADHAWIRTYGRDIHPGSAKDVMVNSMRAMCAIVEKLPKEMSPECTSGYEPFIHPHNLTAGVQKSELFLLLRDFKTAGLADQKKILEGIIEEVQKEFPKTKIEMEVKAAYRNMYEKLMDNPRGCDYLFEAAKRAGLNAEWSPIRGGTDGSRLTEMGLPCPNIFTGGENFHSKTEFVSIDALMKSIETMKELCFVWAEKG